MDEVRKRELLERLVAMLCEERGLALPEFGGASVEELFAEFRGLVNTRPAVEATTDLIAAQDELLQGMLAERGVVGLDESVPAPDDARIRLWRGDITRLEADAIVNAANSQMLGCWVPGHHCIDNAIHTFAGMQLRLECARLMEAQGHEEPTGMAKITSGWNLPAKHVVHTVGPIASGRVDAQLRAQLAQSYASCLERAAGAGCRSIAFCCISTGVFGFPARDAAETALAAVRGWLDAHADAVMTVVFNVFLASDEAIYKELLGIS